MNINYYLSILFISCISYVKSQTVVCPTGTLEYSSYAMISAEALQWKSINSDIFYRLTNQTGSYKLNCHKITDQTNVVNPTVQLQNISLDAQKTWRITAVSESGNCVGILSNGKKLTTYNTASGSFVSGQSIDISAYSGSNIQYNLNSNCSILKLVLTDTKNAVTTKVFKDGSEASSLVLPQGTIFDSDYNYAIDKSSNFYKFINNAYTLTKIPNLKSNPVAIKWSSSLKSLIIISNDNSGYSITVIDPINPANIFQKTLISGTDYTGQIQSTIISQSGIIMLRSAAGLTYFAVLTLQNNVAIATQFTLEKDFYKSLFNLDALVSISSDIVFVYNNEKISYFQTYKGKIYELGQITSNIATTLASYGTQYSPKQLKYVLSIISPESFQTCTPIPSNSTTNTTTTPTLNSDEAKMPTAVDPLTGAIIKCPDSCTGCTSSQICTSCKIGYTLNSQTGQCIFCDGCKTCNAKTSQICYSCFAPEVLDSKSFTCVLPQCTDAKCLQCDLAGACLKCLQGYSKVNGICQKCTMKGCKSCSAGINVCDLNSCLKGYVYYSSPTTGKKSCQSCAGGCDGCLTTDISACITCTPGYYPQADSDNINRCLTCFTNCKQCTSATLCTKCAAGYIPSSDKSKCEIKCSDNCLTCDPMNADLCLSCYSGSNLLAETKKCSVDLSCNNTKSCTLCGDGYVLSTGYCYQCTYTDTHCTSCLQNGLSTCSKCITGYYLKTGACNKCADNCLSCVGQAACSKCTDGYYLVTTQGTDTGSCSICDSQCKTCSEMATTCTTCPDKYVLEGSKCISINRVVLSLVLQANVQNIIEFMDDLINWFVDTINSGKPAGAAKITSREVAIQKVRKYGSSILDAAISSGSASNANAASSAMNSAISSGAAIGGYAVISGSAAASVQPVTINPQQSTSSNNVGIILGVIIPICLLVVVGIFIVVYKKIQRDKENEIDFLSQNEKDDYEKNSCTTKNFSYSSNSYPHQNAQRI